jgi:hypothetical protein
VASGIGLGTSLDIGGLATWAQLWNWEAAVKLVPTVASCLAMIATLEHFSHPLALPAVLAAINLLFHAVRLALGVSMATAMDHQWVIRPAVSERGKRRLYGGGVWPGSHVGKRVRGEDRQGAACVFMWSRGRPERVDEDLTSCLPYLA